MTVIQHSLPISNVGLPQIDLTVTSSLGLQQGPSRRFLPSCYVSRVRPFLLLSKGSLRAHNSSFAENGINIKIRKSNNYCSGAARGVQPPWGQAGDPQRQQSQEAQRPKGKKNTSFSRPRTDPRGTSPRSSCCPGPLPSPTTSPDSRPCCRPTSRAEDSPLGSGASKPS